MKPVYLLHGDMPDYYRREGNDWRTTSQIAHGLGITTDNVHQQFQRLRRLKALQSKPIGGRKRAYRLRDEMLAALKTNDMLSGWALRELGPVIDELYLQGVAANKLAEAFDLNYDSLRNYICREGLAEIREMRRADLIREAKVRCFKQAA